MAGGVRAELFLAISHSPFGSTARILSEGTMIIKCPDKGDVHQLRWPGRQQRQPLRETFWVGWKERSGELGTGI